MVGQSHRIVVHTDSQKLFDVVVLYNHTAKQHQVHYHSVPWSRMLVEMANLICVCLCEWTIMQNLVYGTASECKRKRKKVFMLPSWRRLPHSHHIMEKSGSVPFTLLFLYLYIEVNHFFRNLISNWLPPMHLLLLYPSSTHPPYLL